MLLRIIYLYIYIDIVNIYKDIRKKDNYGHLIVDYKRPAKERFRTLNKIYKIEDENGLGEQSKREDGSMGKKAS